MWLAQARSSRPSARPSEWAHFVALGVFAFEEGGAESVGIAGLVRLLPTAVAAPFAASFGDRFPRERFLLALALVWSAALAGSAVASLAGMRAPVFALAAVADYADPFSFLNNLLDGTGIKARKNNNFAYLDDPAYNRKAQSLCTAQHTRALPRPRRPRRRPRAKCSAARRDRQPPPRATSSRHASAATWRNHHWRAPPSSWHAARQRRSLAHEWRVVRRLESPVPPESPAYRKVEEELR